MNIKEFRKIFSSEMKSYRYTQKKSSYFKEYDSFDIELMLQQDRHSESVIVNFYVWFKWLDNYNNEYPHFRENYGKNYRDFLDYNNFTIDDVCSFASKINTFVETRYSHEDNFYEYMQSYEMGLLEARQELKDYFTYTNPLKPKKWSFKDIFKKKYIVI